MDSNAKNYHCRLLYRGVIRVGGKDCRPFLQGLISNDINLCNPETMIFAALLTPQGKFLHDLFIIERDDALLIDCESSRIEDLLKRLATFKLRAKVSLEHVPDYEVWATWGAAAAPGFVADPRLPDLGFRTLAKEDSLTATESLTDYDHHRLTLGVPDGSRDMIIEKSTLLEGNFDLLNGISWTKGCYMGQELTARMHYRTLAKKRVFPVRISGSAPAFGAMIKINGEDIGDMRSQVGSIGLALLNVEKAEAAIKSNVELVSGDSKLTPYQPAWLKL